jgi:rubrerythrin
MSVTLKNLESALAGESVAHIKYRYFAKLCRQAGFSDVADHFEHTADQEILHAWGHLKLLIGEPSVVECLKLAIAGETYEYTEMYPQFASIAKAEQDTVAHNEFRDQISESSEHAEQFKQKLAKAEKVFAALEQVEKKHAAQYEKVLAEVQQ